ncbi:unnamed protein product, partial [Polarella glacialis]
GAEVTVPESSEGVGYGEPCEEAGQGDACEELFVHSSSLPEGDFPESGGYVGLMFDIPDSAKIATGVSYSNSAAAREKTPYTPYGTFSAPTVEDFESMLPAEAADAMRRNHDMGECRPCSFFYFREDGCRHGDYCRYCHLCTAQEASHEKRQFKHKRRGEHRRAQNSTSTTHWLGDEQR